MGSQPFWAVASVGLLSHFHNELGRFVCKHFGEELVVWGVVVVLREGREREDFSIKVVSLSD